MKPASSGEKKPPSKTRRKNSDDGDGKGKSSSRRKSSDGSGRSSEQTRKDLSVIAKATSSRRSSKAGGDENASAFSGGSGSSGQRKGATTGRTRSPAREGEEGVKTLKKKSSVDKANSGRRKSTNTEAQSTFTPDSNNMWDTPSFFGSATKSDDPNSGSAFASALDTAGTKQGASDESEGLDNSAFADNTMFASFGGDEIGASDRKTEKKSLGFADFDQQGTFSRDNTFGGNAAFATSSSQRDNLDKSPLKDPPRRKVGTMSLVEKKAFSQNFACQPVKNPTNGNIIFCTSRDGEMYIQEVDPSRNFVQVMASPILTPELHRKVTTKYSRSAYGVDNVLKLCVGMHQSHGQPRVRIVAVVDLLVLDSKHILRAIAVWQWGYGASHPISLQFLLSPPSGTDYAYNPESILAADNLVFVAGASAKGPCVFMCKPSLRESWSANFLGNNGKITSMAVTMNPKRKHPYLAVAMVDGSVSVWTYSVALRQAASKKNEPFRRLLFPLCRLDALWVLKSIQPTSFADGDKKQKTDDKGGDAGYCTSLEWLPPQPAVSSLLLLAAGFQGGFAVFHVALPLVSDGSAEKKFVPVANPMHSTQLNTTPQLRPFAAVRFAIQQQEVFISWVDFGPHNNPCLAMLFRRKSPDDDPGRVILGVVNVTEYRKGTKQKESLASFRLLANTAWRSKTKSFPTSLLSCSANGGVLCHTEEGMGVTALYPTFSSRVDDPTVISLQHPVSSLPPGVDSAGEVLGTDTAVDTEGILHVFSVTQCDRYENDQQPNVLNWARPARRHWLCRTLCGDRKDTQVHEEANQFDDDDYLTVGGGLSSVVCELEDQSLLGLTPCRIVRCFGSSVAGVLFRPALGHSAYGTMTGLSAMDCVSIAMVEEVKSGATVIEVIEGRDVAFLPSPDPATLALILDTDGSSLYCYQKATSGWSKGKACRPILGVECDDNYIEAQRIFVLRGGAKYCLAVVGKKHSGERSCLTCGRWAGIDQLSGDDWTYLLPEVSSAEACLWFQDGEDVLTAICLPSKANVPPKIAVSTSKRVLILSTNLVVLAESRTIVASGALAPMGSSAVAYCSRDARIQYLCCLKGNLASGIIATLPEQLGSSSLLLLAVRSDRVLYARWHAGSTLVEQNDDPNCFLLPTVLTKPAIILEPMVANAISEGARNGESTELLRLVIEKFGRKVASITHGDEEGIGNKGAGITPRVFELLSKYGLKQASSWLLTGGVMFDRSTNSKILPPWIPVSAKQEAGLNSDALLHLVSNGDQYLFEYVQSPEQNMPSNLPRCGDSTPYMCREFGLEALASGDTTDALKMLDLVGSVSSENMLLQLSLLGAINSGDTGDLLKALSGFEVGNSVSSRFPTSTSALAALAISKKATDRAEEVKAWMKPLAPSLQRGTHFQRARQRLLEERVIAAVGGSQKQDTNDRLWNTPCSESRHIWNEGPGKEKESLLLLDNLEDWLGRRKPSLLGKAGVEAAEERGEGALANILDMDNKEDEGQDEEGEDAQSDTKGWDERVGEGRKDEENLSGYFRFWEGEDEEIPWRTEGFSDLSRYECKAVIVGQGGGLALQETTSSVDEGEPGKVKPLYDLVYEESGDQEPSGLAIAATRGNSIDVGVLHQPEHSARQRCTLEFWYYLPPASTVVGDIVLARRTFGEDADDFSKVCIASDRRSMLWELVLMKSGELEMRTCGGTVVRSTQNASNEPSNEDDNKPEFVTFERWNHACIIFSSRGAGNISKCFVSLYMMGVAVVESSETSMLPAELTLQTLDSKIDHLMEKSHVIFGINPPATFRLTEIRIWACERNDDDIKMMMREYLDAAEVRKKKFRVKIGKNKKGVGSATILAPKAETELSPPKTKGLAPPKGGLAPPKGGLAPPKSSRSLLAPPKASTTGRAGLLAPPRGSTDSDPSGDPGDDKSSTETKELGGGTDFEPSFGAFGSPGDQKQEDSTMSSNFALQDSQGGDDGAWGGLPSSQEEEEGLAAAPKKSIWDGAIPLSQQVRSSAAAALIRGPPATRHFGGNRGGLPDLRGRDRYGVGGIAICGSEKTIVWRDEEDPPALTYPIGASGAIVSDQLDDEEGSEFLCCFLAKDKRMVVFELNSRTVVVELQMTTKLNFWRFLPPEAGESTLCFMLITPVGGFHWMPLDDSPRPRQVWKRGGDLQGKKIVSYEEGGSNGLTGPEMISKVGLICVTDSNGNGTLEAWIVPICGDSAAVLVSSDVQGAAFCLPEYVEGAPFLPHMALVVKDGDALKLSICTIAEGETGSVSRGAEIASQPILTDELGGSFMEPPTLAMGVFPSSLVCSLGSYIVVLMRSAGLMLGYELKENTLHLIATETIGHYVVDAVMRYSAIEGGIEIVMLLSDNHNSKDGRIACFNFRSQA